MEIAPEKFEEVSTTQQKLYSDQPDVYLLNNSVAIYKSGYELLETFNSIIGNNPRTNRFYERKDLGVSPTQLIQNFIRKAGIKRVTTLVSSAIPLQDIWGLLVHFPKLLLNADATASAKKPVTEFCEALLRKMETLTPEAGGLFAATDRTIFTSKLDVLLRQLYPPALANDRMLSIRAKLQIEVPSPILPPVGKEEPRPVAKRQGLTVRTDLEEERRVLDRHYEFTPDAEGAASDDPFGDHGSMIEHDEERESETLGKMKEYVDQKFKQCMEMISQAGSKERLQGKDYRLQEVFKEHSSCDQQEFAILSAMETLLTENELSKALKLLRWRKKVLKIAAISGWETASLIARKTVDVMEVTARDLIEENLKAWSFVSDQSVGAPEGAE